MLIFRGKIQSALSKLHLNKTKKKSHGSGCVSHGSPSKRLEEEDANDLALNATTKTIKDSSSDELSGCSKSRSFEDEDHDDDNDDDDDNAGHVHEANGAVSSRPQPPTTRRARSTNEIYEGRANIEPSVDHSEKFDYSSSFPENEMEELSRLKPSPSDDTLEEYEMTKEKKTNAVHKNHDSKNTNSHPQVIYESISPYVEPNRKKNLVLQQVSGILWTFGNNDALKGVYSGPVLHGRIPHGGHGTISFVATGDTYEGPIHEGMMHGSHGAVYHERDTNSVYKGGFRCNLRHGHGEYYHDGGRSLAHMGNYENGIPSGYGRSYTADGTLFHEGHFENGIPEHPMIPFQGEEASLMSTGQLACDLSSMCTSKKSTAHYKSHLGTASPTKGSSNDAGNVYDDSSTLASLSPMSFTSFLERDGLEYAVDEEQSQVDFSRCSNDTDDVLVWHDVPPSEHSL